MINYRDVVLADRPRAYWPMDDRERVLINDDFTRADSSSSIGGSWTADVGTWGISSNQAYNVSATTDAYCTQDVGQIGIISFTVVTGASGEAGAYFRVQDSSNWFRVIYNGTGFSLQKKVAGSQTTITTGGSGFAGTRLMEIIINPVTNSIKVYSDGFSNTTPLLSATDSALATATKCGPGFGTGSSSPRIDNFKVWAAMPLRDLSGHGYDGEYTIQESAGGAAPALGSRFNFDVGSPRATGGRGVKLFSKGVIFPPTAAGQNSIGSFSRECWVYTTSATDQYLISQYNASDGEDFWIIKSTGSYRVFMFSGGGFKYDENGTADSTRSPLDGRAHHLVYTRKDGGQVRIYRDGYQVLNASGGSGGTLNSTNNPLYCGRNNKDLNNQFLGVMSDVAVYDYDLSPSQVLAHYRAGMGIDQGTIRRRGRLG